MSTPRTRWMEELKPRCLYSCASSTRIASMPRSSKFWRSCLRSRRSRVRASTFRDLMESLRSRSFSASFSVAFSSWLASRFMPFSRNMRTTCSASSRFIAM